MEVLKFVIYVFINAACAPVMVFILCFTACFIQTFSLIAALFCGCIFGSLGYIIIRITNKFITFKENS